MTTEITLDKLITQAASYNTASNINTIDGTVVCNILLNTEN